MGGKTTNHRGRAVWKAASGATVLLGTCLSSSVVALYADYAYSLTLSDQAEVTRQLSVSLSDLV